MAVICQEIVVSTFILMGVRGTHFVLIGCLCIGGFDTAQAAAR